MKKVLKIILGIFLLIIIIGIGIWIYESYSYHNDVYYCSGNGKYYTLQKRSDIDDARINTCTKTKLVCGDDCEINFGDYTDTKVYVYTIGDKSFLYDLISNVIINTFDNIAYASPISDETGKLYGFDYYSNTNKKKYFYNLEKKETTYVYNNIDILTRNCSRSLFSKCGYTVSLYEPENKYSKNEIYNDLGIIQKQIDRDKYYEELGSALVNFKTGETIIEAPNIYKTYAGNYLVKYQGTETPFDMKLYDKYGNILFDPRKYNIPALKNLSAPLILDNSSDGYIFVGGYDSVNIYNYNGELVLPKALSYDTIIKSMVDAAPIEKKQKMEKELEQSWGISFIGTDVTFQYQTTVINKKEIPIIVFTSYSEYNKCMLSFIYNFETNEYEWNNLLY